MASSLEKRCTAADEKASLDVAQELLVASPPVMAYVPDRWPDGRSKDVCGWQVGGFGQGSRAHCRALPRSSSDAMALSLLSAS